MTETLSPAQYDRIMDTMAPAVAMKIISRFAAALDAGHDLYDPETRTCPAGEIVIAEMVAEGRALGWAETTISMLRWNIRAVGRQLIIAALADL